MSVPSLAAIYMYNIRRIYMYCDIMTNFNYLLVLVGISSLPFCTGSPDIGAKE